MCMHNVCIMSCSSRSSSIPFTSSRCRPTDTLHTMPRILKHRDRDYQVCVLCVCVVCVCVCVCVVTDVFLSHFCPSYKRLGLSLLRDSCSWLRGDAETWCFWMLRHDSRARRHAQDGPQKKRTCNTHRPHTSCCSLHTSGHTCVSVKFRILVFREA